MKPMSRTHATPRWLAALLMLSLSGTAQAVEEPDYELLRQDGDFELRAYGATLVAENVVNGEFEEAGNRAFRALFKYIDGNNREQREIAMTAPVKQEKKDNRWRITFLMPAEYTLETLPEPNDPRVRLTEESGRLMVAVKYSGTWSEEGYEENRAPLEEYIHKRGLTKTGEPVWARYDPPFMPWFLRRNEVLIPIEKY